jgi:hypothetical protein
MSAQASKAAAVEGPAVHGSSPTSWKPVETGTTDCELRDWRQAGLHQPSFFRLFPVTLLQREVRLIGRLSECDWTSVRACFQAAFGSV